MSNASLSEASPGERPPRPPRTACRRPLETESPMGEYLHVGQYDSRARTLRALRTGRGYGMDAEVDALGWEVSFRVLDV